MMNPQKTQCVKHILTFYTGSGKGVASTLNTSVLEYPIQLTKIQCKMMCMLSIKAGMIKLRMRSDRIRYCNWRMRFFASADFT